MCEDLLEKIENYPGPDHELQKVIINSVKKCGLGETLKAIYAQQIETGYILSNPTKITNQEKVVFDQDTLINFIAQWNPDRELRKNNKLLTEKGVVRKDVDPKDLINLNSNNVPCHLCKHNINLQKPKEITLDINLAGEQFFIGANFASIADNHFTIINKRHRLQKYRKKIPTIMVSLLEKTGDSFRIIYNGLAGASIEDHEHFQAVTRKMPIESIKIDPSDLVYNKNETRTFSPKYYSPLWIVEGKDKSKIATLVNDLVLQWQSINPENTENLLATKDNDLYKFFIFLRNKQKLYSEGKEGTMATFELSGFIVLSKSESEYQSLDERNTFDNISLEKIKEMLTAISPDKTSVSHKKSI